MTNHDPQQSVIGLLGHMVSYDTVNSNVSGKPSPERPLAEALERLAAGWNLSTRRLPISGDDFNLLVHLPPVEGRPWLLFESHLDTVSVEGMTIPPFAAEIRDGRMYGRGALDTKSSGAAMLWALKELLPEAAALPNNVGLLFSIDEEIGKLGARSFARQQLPDLGWRPELTIVGEPTELGPVIAHNGVARFIIETRGTPVHSSSPEKGRSAISDMVRVIDHLETNYIPALSAEHHLTGRARCSINIIRGGHQINIIPDYCKIEIDRRIVPTENHEVILPEFEREMEELRKLHPGLKVEVSSPDRAFVDPPMRTLEEERITAFLRPVLVRHGIDPTPTGVPYGTDASNFTAVGLSAVVLGPGNIAQAHTVDEWIDLEQVEKALVLYKDIARNPLRA